jgi:hypothetical protein
VNGALLYFDDAVAHDKGAGVDADDYFGWFLQRGSLFLPLMRLNKNIKIFINYFLGPLLFLWLLYSITSQIRQQTHLAQSWRHLVNTATPHKIGLLIAVFGLMLLNWSAEAAKWKFLVAAVHPVSFGQALRSVLSGVSVSISMPNRLGEYSGRVLHLPEGSRLKAVPLSVAGSISQLLVTFLGGLAGLTVLQSKLLSTGTVSRTAFLVLLWVTAALVLLLTIFYFRIAGTGRWLQRQLYGSRYAYLLQALQGCRFPLLGKLLLLSALRYAIFSLQYVLLFSFFEVHVAPWLAWNVTAVLFLALSVMPTIVVVEPGLRGQLSLQLMGLFSANSLGIVLTAATVWVINLILPALAGSIVILNRNVIKRKNERV